MVSNVFGGSTKICKVIAGVVIIGHICVHIFPSSLIYVALIPARTIPFGWNLVTASYIEQTIHGVVISTIGFLFIGKLLEPIWGSREFLKFIFVVNLLTNICVFITAISVYYITMEEIYLYMPLSGSGGALSGLLVGVKQIMPDQEMSPLKIKAKWLPSIVLFLSIGMSLFSVEPATCLPILLFGTYIGWIYLRYFQRKQETKVQGDPSDEFAFSTFFPESIRPLVDPISSIFHQMLFGRPEVSIETRGYTVGTAVLPGSDSIEASRRRERGARALEERLAAERLTSIGRTAEPNRIATEKV
uniref:rhomboid-like protein 19 n=1 Tax=Erigeron canadensis TaxID=72917 RepID=UPI001CB96253|nr:rhomboid-like protein 19 [Erigeron canadensis]